jgi:crotonobetainyl-CoA:carnitine CoA-transferase CaiB-like acyl-CoA transferase
MSLLPDVCVVDFGRFIACPCCTARLGAPGADVDQVERIEGGAHVG